MTLQPVSHDDRPEAGQPVVRRFLGGQSSAEVYRNKLRKSLQVTVVMTVFCLCGLAFVSLLTWPFRTPGTAPLVATLAVTRYSTPSIPPSEFGLQDALRIQRASGILNTSDDPAAAIATAYDDNDFRHFLKRQVGEVAAETCVVYIHAHGVSHQEQAFLLAADARPDRPDSGFPVDEMLNTLMTSRASNILLILDAQHFQHDLSLGILGNDFSYLLRDAFTRLSEQWRRQPALREKNLTVLCASDDGQRNWTSRALNGSSFGVAVAYCLRGGADAERLDGEPKDRGWISVAELSEYVQSSVTTWAAENRKAPQSPVLLQFGGDFRLSPVNPELTLDDVLTDGTAAASLADTAGEIAAGDTSSSRAPSAVRRAATNATVTAARNAASTAVGTAADGVAGPMAGNVAGNAAGNAAGKATAAAVKPGAGGAAKTADKPAAAGEDDAASEAASPAAEDAPAGGPAPPSEAEMLAGVRAVWEQRQQFAASRSGLAKPLHLNSLDQALQRAEMRLITGQTEAVQQILEEEIPPLTAALQTCENCSFDATWSLAFARGADGSDAAGQPGDGAAMAGPGGAAADAAVKAAATAADGSAGASATNGLFQGTGTAGPGLQQLLHSERELVQAALMQPSDENLSRLRNHPSAEACLLRLLAETCRTGNNWRDRELVELAVRTRTLSEQMIDFDRLECLAFLRSDIDAADRLRWDAQNDLILGRDEAAEQGLFAATAAYQKVLADAKALTAALQVAQQQVLWLLPMLDWIGDVAAQSTSGERAQDAQLLADFLKALEQFCATPDRNRCLELGRQAQFMQLRFTRNVLKSLESPQYASNLAALKFPGLDPELRGQLLTSLLTARDARVLKAGKMSGVVSAGDGPANPYPLLPFFEFLNSVNPRVSQTGMLDLLQRLQQSEQPALSLREPGLQPGVRETRAAATNAMQLFLARLASPALLVDKSAPWWTRRMQFLALSSWMTGTPHQVQQFDLLYSQLPRESLKGELDWMMARLGRENEQLPGDSYRPAIDAIAARIREFDPEYRAAPRRTAFQLAGMSTAEILPGQPMTVPFRLTMMNDLPSDTRAEIVFNWNSRGNTLHLEVDGVPDDSGRVVRTIDTLVARREYRYQLTVVPRKSSEIPDDVSITAQVRLSTGQTDWFPIHLTTVRPPQKPAELVLSWDDGGVQKGRLDLYPNQGLPISLKVRNIRADVANLRLELIGEREPVSIPLAGMEAQGNMISIIPKPPLQIPFLRDNITIRLYEGDVLLDEVPLQVAVLDLLQCFRCRTVYDPLARRLAARMERIHASDVDEPVSFRLALNSPDIAGDTLQQGNFELTLKRDVPAGTLSAQLPAGVRDPLRFAISSCGVPRLFRTIVGRNQLDGVPDDELTLRIVDPPAGYCYAFQEGSTHIPVQIQLDGPDRVSCVIGLDLNRNGHLEDEEVQIRREYWQGRATSLQLVASADPPGLRVQSQVGDIEVPLDITGRAGQQIVMVRAASPARSVTRSIPIYVLRTAPSIRVTFPLPNSPISGVEPLAVTVFGEPDTYLAIERLEFAFDKNLNGEIDPTESVVPLGFEAGQSAGFTDSARVTVSLPVLGLESGPVSLLVRTMAKGALPGAAPASAPEPAPGAAPAPAPAAATKEFLSQPVRVDLRVATTGRIRGVVVGPDGVPQKGARLFLTGFGASYSDQMGQFSFENLPPGEYRVYARVNGRAGEVGAIVRAARTAQVEVKVYLR